MTIRPATLGDLPAYRQIVDEAYAPYVPRIGRKPAPMLDDHAARIAAGTAFVAEAAGEVAGVLVLLDQPDHLLLDSIAVGRAHRRTGIGRALLGFAEAEARRRGFAEIRLYTNEAMVENIALYGRIGYTETSRGAQSGFRRVNFRKLLGAEAGREAGGGPEIAG